jgi:hypothetical protein
LQGGGVHMMIGEIGATVVGGRGVVGATVVAGTVVGGTVVVVGGKFDEMNN